MGSEMCIRDRVDAAGNKVGTANSAPAIPAVAPAAEAAATENSGNRVLKAFTDAMRPKEEVPPLNNDRLTVYLSDEVIFGQYERSGARYGLDRSRVHLGLVYSEERDTVIQSGLAVDAAFASSFRLSFGTRGYVAILGEENTDSVAAGLGGEIAYQLPFRALPLEFGANFYYAPDVLTFGSADRVIDGQFDVTLPIRSSLSVFAGARFLQFDTRPGDEEVDNRVHLGARWDFL